MNYDKLTKEEIIKILDDTLGYIDKQEKEIEELKAEIKELNDDNVWWTNRFNAVERDNRELKARIDKAIEYIQDRYDEEALIHTFDKCNVKELLEILQGSDKE